MSRLGSRGGLAFASGEHAKAVDLRKETQAQRAGTRYHGRGGLRSMMDTASQDAKILERYASYGGGGDKTTAGVYNMKIVDDEGGEMKHANINIGGRTFTSDDAGNLRILDPQYINEEIAYHEEIQNYEMKLVKAILVSNVMAGTILGKTAFDKLKKAGKVDGMAQELVDTEATPDAIQFYDPTSAVYARAVAKIKMVVHDTGIVLNEEAQSLHKAGTSTGAAAGGSSHDA